jgi:RND family efflux transporter MFP subunit
MSDSSQAKPDLGRLKIDRSETAPTASSWRLIGIVAAVVSAVAVAWFFWPGGEAEVRVAAARKPSTLRTASVLDASGYVTARRQATVSAKRTGKVRVVLVEEGMLVESGQVLAHLDDATEQAQLALATAQFTSARAALAEIEASLKEARLNLRRSEELAARQLISTADLDAARAAEEALAARLEAGREQVNVAGRTVALQEQQLDETVIRAPFGGVVIAKTAQPGEMISPVSAGGGFTRTGICTIVDMASLEIEVDVNEAYIQRVRAGQPATAVLDAYPDWRIPAEVIAIVPTADRQKATVKVRVGFLERDARVLPDMGVKVAFMDAAAAPGDNEPPAGVLIPASAIVRANGQDRVWVLERGRVRSQLVGLGTEAGQSVQVLSGLAVGERVVVDNHDALGSKVPA